ncbi:MAG TPA: hypothetical protein VGK89_04200 [Candidatus Eisenbacteria bacterium]
MSHDLRYWIETISLWKPLVSGFRFLWGAHDPLWLMTIKRCFLLLPLGAIAFGYWASVLSVPSLLVRTHRRTYVGLVLITWWDLARATFTFWGGVLRFLLRITISALGLAQVLIVGVWTVIKELFLMPLRLLRNVGSNFMAPGTPWIAVFMTFFWCVFEAIIFTFVMTSLVIDTLSNLAGTQLTESAIRIPLFLFMLFIALGSYAVLSTFTQAVQSRNWATVVKIGVVESVALFVEVVFLYREFVDALVPWFAQHTSGKFELGIWGTLGIAGLTWLGIRSLSWFLFASAGTPTIMAIIQGQGVGAGAGGGGQQPLSLFSPGFLTQLQSEFSWVADEGERLVSAFLVPPMQLIAAALNFVTLLVSNRHFLDLPLTSIKDFKDARALAKDLLGNPSAAKANP